ncbi:ornithine cyclodeaminase family protein [bacterium]|nr:ornithine cyclodeaminase family protein [bacterium]MCI0605600.1 ornithine cyclodeaminase family protein [bacterium]
MIYINEEQVKRLLSVRDCIEVLRNAFSLEYINIPRYRLKSKNSLLHVMSASIPSLLVMGLKSYGTSRSGGSFAVLLFDEPSGELLAIFEGDALGQIRTGAASGLATDLLANRDVKIGAVIGTGFQAETQLLAIDAVRQFEQIRIYSRREEARREFIDKMQSQVRATLVNASSSEECVRDADVVSTITSSKDPVVEGRWLKPGVHINAAGSNSVLRRELDADAVRLAGLLCTDDRAQSKIEAGDFVDVLTEEQWNHVHELQEIVKRKYGRTSSEQRTLFKSNGIALEDVASAHYIYSRIKLSS